MARRFVLSVAVVLAGCGETLPPGVDCTFAAMESDYGTVPMTFRLDPDAVSASSNLHVDGDALVPDAEGEFTFTRESCPRVTGRRCSGSANDADHPRARVGDRHVPRERGAPQRAHHRHRGQAVTSLQHPPIPVLLAACLTTNARAR